MPTVTRMPRMHARPPAHHVGCLGDAIEPAHLRLLLETRCYRTGSRTTFQEEFSRMLGSHTRGLASTCGCGSCKPSLPNATRHKSLSVGYSTNSQATPFSPPIGDGWREHGRWRFGKGDRRVVYAIEDGLCLAHLLSDTHRRTSVHMCAWPNHSSTRMRIRMTQATHHHG